MRKRTPRTTTCFQCKTEHSAEHFERVVHNKCELHGPWSGWRMAGRDLVSPDGDRINPRRLRGLLWVERATARLRPEPRKIPSPSVLPAREKFAGSA